MIWALKQAGLRSALAIALLTTGLAVSAGTVTIGNGNTINLGTAQVDLGCADINIYGSLYLGSQGSLSSTRDVAIQTTGVLNVGTGNLAISGDWNNAGNFSAGTGTVSFSNGCGRTSSGLSGDSTFWNLVLETATGRQYALAADSTQTIVNSLSIDGQAGNLLQLRSSVECTPAYIDLQGSGSGRYLDVDCVEVLTRTFDTGAGSMIGQNATGFRFEDDISADILVIIIKKSVDLNSTNTGN